jgi:maltose O-acetyltransferase
MLASSFFGSCGPNLCLGRSVSFYNPSMIYLGADVYVAYGCRFIAGEKIQVDDGVIVGPYCVVVSSKHTREGGSFRWGPKIRKPVHIKSGCYIASHVVLASGCVVGEGSLVAAGSVVTGELPPRVMAAGRPAKV